MSDSRCSSCALKAASSVLSCAFRMGSSSVLATFLGWVLRIYISCASCAIYLEEENFLLVYIWLYYLQQDISFLVVLVRDDNFWGRDVTYLLGSVTGSVSTMPIVEGLELCSILYPVPSVSNHFVHSPNVSSKSV